ncbi:histidine--tRNA ligase, cytoplasmic [Trifolium repens]|nr:histidine--tRNA ligase, cytoplasmic [Trifolium repens]
MSMSPKSVAEPGFLWNLGKIESYKGATTRLKDGRPSQRVNYYVYLSLNKSYHETLIEEIGQSFRLKLDFTFAVRDFCHYYVSSTLAFPLRSSHYYRSFKVEEKGLSAKEADRIGIFVKEKGHPLTLLSKLKQEGSAFLENAGSVDALNDLEILFNALDGSKWLDKVVFDLSLVTTVWQVHQSVVE